METTLGKVLWQQLGASLDMLKNAISVCPDLLWNNPEKFWYQAYHCVFFLDYYLSVQPIGFVPPSPFTLSEFEDKPPPRLYTKDEILHYLSQCRIKAFDLINYISLESAEGIWQNESKTMTYSYLEITMYNMRHVQHHTAQLNVWLKAAGYEASPWLCRAES
jgi:DinB family